MRYRIIVVDPRHLQCGDLPDDNRTKVLPRTITESLQTDEP